MVLDRMNTKKCQTANEGCRTFDFKRNMIQVSREA